MGSALSKRLSHTPKITVLMPVYNGERYLRQAMESILGQSFTDFEFLIFNDGSTDESAEIVRSYKDLRIRFLENESNKGLIATLNAGIAISRGEYIARMDCDDVSLPNRLEKQVAYMDQHPHIGISGTWFKTFGGSQSVTVRLPTDPMQIRCASFFNSCIGHPTAMMRRAILDLHKLKFDINYRDAEDYAFWVEALKCTKLGNLGEVHLLYRQHDEQVSVRHLHDQIEALHKTRRELLATLGVEANHVEYELHSFLAAPTLDAVCSMSQDKYLMFMDIGPEWLRKLYIANSKLGAYPQPFFSQMLLGRWLIFSAQLAVVRGPSQVKWTRLYSLLDMLRLERGHTLQYLSALLFTVFTGAIDRLICRRLY